MTTTEPTARTVRLGDRDVLIERPSGLKATRALGILKAIAGSSSDLQRELARFRSEYERDHVVELDRVQAKIRFPPQPLVRDGELVPNPDNPDHVLMVPSPVDRITDEDWERAGGVYRAQRSPSQEEVIVALFDHAMTAAEAHLYRFLAVFTIPNADLKRARAAGDLEGVIDRAADELLDDAFADELIDLASAVGDTVDQHFARKARDLDGGLGKLLGVLGIRAPRTPAPASPTATPTSAPQDAPTSSRPSSSTDSPGNTPDGPPTSSSTPRTTSSSSSPASSSAISAPPTPAPSSTD